MQTGSRETPTVPRTQLCHSFLSTRMKLAEIVSGSWDQGMCHLLVQAEALALMVPPERDAQPQARVTGHLSPPHTGRRQVTPNWPLSSLWSQVFRLAFVKWLNGRYEKSPGTRENAAPYSNEPRGEASPWTARRDCAAPLGKTGTALLSLPRPLAHYPASIPPCSWGPDIMLPWDWPQQMLATWFLQCVLNKVTE